MPRRALGGRKPLAEANIWPIYRRFYDIALRWREAHHRGDRFETPKLGAT
jgi:hypothetical protein